MYKNKEQKTYKKSSYYYSIQFERFYRLYKKIIVKKVSDFLFKKAILYFMGIMGIYPILGYDLKNRNLRSLFYITYP